MKQSALLAQQREREKQMRNYGALLGQQFNVDMMCLALNDEGFGHDRIMRVLKNAEQYSNYFKDILSYNVETDVKFEQLDNRLKFIARDHPEDFIPREKRYECVLVPDMNKKFRAEPIGVIK